MILWSLQKLDIPLILPNNYLFINRVKIYRFKAKESKLIGYPLCLVNAKYNMEETGLNGWVYDFSVDYYSVDVDGIFDIHRYLMKSIDVRYCLSL